MPRAFSSGALSIVSNARYCASPFRARYFVIAAVRVVLPWSMWPIVPTLTCGLVRSNRFLPIVLSFRKLASAAGGDRFGHVLRHLLVVGDFHRVAGAPLGHRAQIGRVAEHL